MAKSQGRGGRHYVVACGAVMTLPCLQRSTNLRRKAHFLSES
jgi:hypothetical protein